MKGRALNVSLGVVRLGMACVLAGCFRTAPFVPPGSADRSRLAQRVEASPDDVDAVVPLAVLDLSEGRSESARTSLERALARAPADPALPVLLALAEAQVGRADSASVLLRSYADAHTGSLARLARAHGNLIDAEANRARARRLLERPLPASVEPVAGSVAVLPFAGGVVAPGADVSSAMQELLSADLREHGWTAFDPRLVRTLLDEMSLLPVRYADLSVALEVGRRLEAQVVVQGWATVSAGSAIWNVTLTSAADPSLIELIHLSLLDGGESPSEVERRLSVLVRERLEGESAAELREPAHTTAPEAFHALGAAVTALDRGEIEAARALLAEAVRLDPAFAEASDQLTEVEEMLALAATPRATQLEEIARLGALHRAVLALQAGPTSSHSDALRRVGRRDRPILLDALGLDRLLGAPLVGVTLSTAGAGAPGS